MRSKDDIDRAVHEVLMFLAKKKAPFEVERQVLLLSAAWHEQRRILDAAGIVAVEVQPLDDEMIEVIP